MFSFEIYTCGELESVNFIFALFVWKTNILYNSWGAFSRCSDTPQSPPRLEVGMCTVHGFSWGYQHLFILINAYAAMRDKVWMRGFSSFKLRGHLCLKSQNGSRQEKFYLITCKSTRDDNMNDFKIYKSITLLELITMKQLWYLLLSKYQSLRLEGVQNFQKCTF